jgi:hypothetical protein
MMLSMLEPMVLNAAVPEDPGVYRYQTEWVLPASCEVHVGAGIGSPISVVAPEVARLSPNPTVFAVIALAKSSLAGGVAAAALRTPVPPVPAKSDNMM